MFVVAWQKEGLIDSEKLREIDVREPVIILPADLWVSSSKDDLTPLIFPVLVIRPFLDESQGGFLTFMMVCRIIIKTPELQIREYYLKGCCRYLGPADSLPGAIKRGVSWMDKSWNYIIDFCEGEIPASSEVTISEPLEIIATEISENYPPVVMKPPFN